MENEVGILEVLTNELVAKGVPISEVEQQLHVASMLSLVEASYKVVHQTTMPTPLYRIEYDPDNHNVQLEKLEGRAPVPREGTLDVNVLDMLISSLLKEKMPILLEGKTGVGKTYTVEQFMKTILPEENYRGLRLNANMSNVLQPYTQGNVENGLVKISLKEEELHSIAALFIDEVNRGDTNQVLQLQDGVIRLSSGEGGELGLPIPRLTTHESKDLEGNTTTTWNWNLDYVKKRPLYVISAQNPPMTKDAKYSGTRRSDAAQSNRNLQLDVPNSASNIGASVLLLDTPNGLHSQFITNYKKELARKLNIDEAKLEKLDEDWSRLYAFAADPQKTACPSIKSAIEFVDGILTMVCPNLQESFEFEKSVSKEWSKVLNKYKVDFSYDGQLTSDAKSLEKIRDIVSSFKEEVITRDIVKVKKLSDAMSLTRRIKESLCTNDPVAAYNAAKNYVTVQDVASGFAIMLHDKQDKHDTNPTILIDTVLREYTGITESFAEKMGYRHKFRPDDFNMSVYNLAFGHALMAVTNKTGPLQNAVQAITKTNPHKYVTSFVNDLGKSVAGLKRLEAGNEYRKPMLARMIADITTLAGFANQYKDQLEDIFTNAPNYSERGKGFKAFYRELRGKISTPDIYAHRLTRVLGV